MRLRQVSPALAWRARIVQSAMLGPALALACLGCGQSSTGRAAQPGPAPGTTAWVQPSSPDSVTVPRTKVLTIASRTLHRTYDLRVQLPPGYEDPRNANRRYPVVYLNDGPLNFLVAAGIAHLPMSEGILEELILVGIGYSRETGSTESRVRDYTPTLNPAFERRTGGAEEYLGFIERELIPYVERAYRVDAERRTLAGHSFGGLFGAYVLFTKPELFQQYLLSSPSFWFHENVTWKLEQTYAETHNDLPAKVYVSIGSLEQPAGTSPYDMVGDVLRFEQKLKARNYPRLQLRATVVAGHNHETVLPIIFANGLLWHFNAKRQIPFGY